MTEHPGEPAAPTPPDERSGPRVGVDEWVARAEEHDTRYAGLGGFVRRLSDHVPWYAWLVVGTAAGVVFGLVESSPYLLTVGVVTVVYMTLAVGLNVVVGWAGLLDLGYIVFWGLGAYGYAWFSSNHFHTHWPAELSVPIIAAGVGIVGLLVGLTSWRLQGDYLAIVTLFLLEIFGNVTTNADKINFPYFGHVAFTNGPNGIADLDRYDVFGLKVGTVRGYLFLSLGGLVLVTLVLIAIDSSRIGRAWRALREDPLAAELLSMPVKRLKLLAFVFGAAIAGFSGTIYGAFQNSVFPTNFLPETLILLYAMVILGGAGSIGGVLLGAFVVNVGLELLRSDQWQGYLFYGLIVLGLVVAGLTKGWRWKAPLVLAGTVGFGYAVHGIVDAVHPAWVKGHAASSGFIGRFAEHWVLAPKDPYYSSRYAFVILIVLVVTVPRLPGIWRVLALIPTLYLAACVWENVLAPNPPATRLLLLGAMLVVLMNVRPQGLLGTARVEIV